MLRKLWADTDGFIVSTELILIASILVLGLVAGLTQIAAEVAEELGDVGAAIGVINQSYSYGGISGHHGVVDGSQFTDATDGVDQTGGSCVQTCSLIGGVGTDGG